MARWYAQCVGGNASAIRSVMDGAASIISAGCSFKILLRGGQGGLGKVFQFHAHSITIRGYEIIHHA